MYLEASITAGKLNRWKSSPVLDVAAPKALDTDGMLWKKHEDYWKLLKQDY